MKYRDEDGNFQELYFKASDTLPIGTEVDYDGDTAPFGWEEIDDAISTVTLTGTITISKVTIGGVDYNEGSDTLSYPEGYTIANTCVVSALCRVGNTALTNDLSPLPYHLEVNTGSELKVLAVVNYNLQASQIVVSFEGIDMGLDGEEVAYKLVLMKVKTTDQGGE